MTLLRVGEMVDYSLSGAIEARVDGFAVALGGPKQRCVLAVLLANHGSVVSIDRLIDAVWEDDAPPKALVSVRSYVANLRRILDGTDAEPGGAHRLESRPSGYRLDLLPGDSVDLFRFETLVAAGRSALVRNDPGGAAGTLGEALTSWRGDPFGEFAYRDFAAPDALRFTALRAAAVEARLDAALQLGAGADLVPDIEAYHGRTDQAHELMTRATTLADTTGEHAWDVFLDQRVARMMPPRLAPSASSRGGGQGRAPLTPHRTIGHQIQHAAETGGLDQRD